MFICLLISSRDSSASIRAPSRQTKREVCVHVPMLSPKTHHYHTGFGAASHVTRIALANQNVANNIPREKSDEWPPCLPEKPEPSNREKDWLRARRTFTVGHKDDERFNCNQLRQIAFIRTLDSTSCHRVARWIQPHVIMLHAGFSLMSSCCTLDSTSCHRVARWIQPHVIVRSSGQYSTT